MSQILENNKRIVRNTIMLYFRMFLILVISLFTSRIVLQVLGVEDFGIYNVVGGIIAMSGIFNGAMSSSVTRYLTFELGRGDINQLKKTFSVSLSIYFILCILFLVLSETIGLWFLNNKLIIPSDRLVAANYVYQYAIFSTIVTLIANPYNASIVSHERMSVYAYVSIAEVVLKLMIVYLLFIIPIDNLVTYGALIFLANIVITLVYIIYCLRNFPECRFQIQKEKDLFKQIFSYSGWNLFGSAAGLVKGQGLNILLNTFFDPVVNAARGISYQINTAIVQFSSNFYTAVRPQIIKYYAKNDLNDMFRLIFKSSKMSFYLILLFSLPVILETQFILLLWLGQIPEYTVEFVRYIIAISAVEAMANPLMTAAHATGRIALYQSLVGTIIMLNIPISYIFLRCGFPPVTVFIVSLMIAVICLFIRLFIVKWLINFPFWEYVKQVFGKCFLTALCAIIIPLLVYVLNFSFCNIELVICFLTLFSTLVTIYTIGLNSLERKYLKEYVFRKIKNNRNGK